MTNRRFWLMAAGIWAIASILLIAVAWTNITNWRFPDPDDQMRLLQVRDWMAGQSWFDVTQHRLNIPIGVPMHWSRLVDLPIAAVILVARPLFGQVGAEQLALVVVPLLTFGAVMAALAALGRRLLGDDEQALMALCVAPLGIEVLHQLRPMRIDHHGWQMALALLAAFALVGGKPKPAGFLTGAAIAIWLSISLEGLPMVAAILAFVALKWAIVPGNRMMLVWTAATTTAGAVGIYALTHGAAAWTGSVCDAVSPVYLAVLAVATAGVIVLTFLPLTSVAARLGGLAVVGAVSLPLVPAIAPQCLAGPFGQLDPLVRHFWYENVAEGLPIWMQTPSVIANTMALPLVGLIGTAIAIRHASDRDRERWITIVFLLGASTLAAVFVQRSGGIANLLAVPGVVRLLHPLLVRARTIRNLPKRLAGTAGIFLVAAPGVTTNMAIAAVSSDPQTVAIRAAANGCLSANDMKAMAALPRGNVLAPLDISPTILLLTPHSAVASGHHRGAAAIHDVILAFTGTDEQAHAIALKRRIDYVAFCPGLAEIMVYEHEAPSGFVARLDRGRVPAWLTPIVLPGSPAKVWRVR